MKNFAFHSARTKTFFASTALLFVAGFSASAVPILSTAVRTTPYERYMTPVRQAFDNMHGEGATMERVNMLMRQGRNFRYSRTDPYFPAPPEETAARRAGDCKDKALWLMNQLQDQNVRFVIGKLDRNARVSHAWLVWEHDGQRWILDCSMFNHPIPADRFGPDEYVPTYSYTKDSAYRH